MREWQGVRNHAQRMRQASRNQGRRLRQFARRSYHLKREVRKQEKREQQLAVTAERLATQLAELRDNRSPAPFILDERRTGQDRGFLTVLSHPEPTTLNPDISDRAAASWKAGRTFIVWAVDEDRAFVKIEQRFPKERGYVLTSLTPEAGSDGDAEGGEKSFGRAAPAKS